MSRSFFRALMVSTGVSVLPFQAMALVEDPHPRELFPKKFVVGAQVVRPNLQSSEANFTGSLEGVKTFKVDARSNGIRLLEGSLGEVDVAGKKLSLKVFSDFISNFVSTHSELFTNIEMKNLELVTSAVILDNKDQFFKYRVRKDGIAVQDASIDFRFKFGKLVQVVNYAFGEAKHYVQASKANLSQDVISALQVKQAKSLGLAYRVVGQNKNYLLKKVEIFEVEKNSEKFHVQVEVATGKIFEIKPLIYKLTGNAHGQVYPRWYQEEPVDIGLPHLTLTAGAATVNTDFEGGFSADALPSVNGLKGPFVDVAVVTGTLINKAATLEQGTYDLTLPRETTPNLYENKSMAQVMIFQHTNLIVATAKKYITAPFLDQVMKANANLSDVCNAHFSPWENNINFYSAGSYGTYNCANTGLISDVVYHEWGHALDHNTGGIDDGAYSEGFGDILALVMTGAPDLAVGFFTSGEGIRNLAEDKVYPDDQGEVHAEGLIIGSTYYDLLQGLEAVHGKEQARQIVANFAFKGILAADRYTDVYEAMRILDDDDADTENGSPNFCIINDAFTRHGLAQLSAMCQLGSVNGFNAEEVSGNQNGVIEPGEQHALNAILNNNTGAEIAGLTASVKVSPAVAGISLSANTLEWDNIPADSQQASRNSLDLQVDSAVACGQGFNVVFALKTEQRAAIYSVPMFVGQFEGSADLRQATDLPKAIRDMETTLSSVNVHSPQWNNGTKVLNAHLKFDITHSYVGDLTVYLVSPAGENIQVFSGSGPAASVHFDADVSDKVAGKVGQGTWQLKVIDDAEADEGTLDSFELSLTGSKFTCE